MTQQQLIEALAGKEDLPSVQAMLAVIDDCIEEVRLESEKKGLGTIERSEACGAAGYMRAMKKAILKLLEPLPPES